METALRMGSPLPAELTDVVLMLETGWSWQALQDTPADVVDNLRILLNKRALIQQEAERKSELRAKR